MIDTSKLNSPRKGHGVNGWNTSLFRARGYRFKNTCACTRTYRCPKHSNGRPVDGVDAVVP